MMQIVLQRMDLLMILAYEVVMFPSGRIFIAKCGVVQESFDDSKDVALLQLEEEIIVNRTANNVPGDGMDLCSLPAGDQGKILVRNAQTQLR